MNPSPVHICLLLASLGLLVNGGSVSQPIFAEDFSAWSEQPAADLLPAASNAVTVVRVENLLNSEWAKAEGESERRQKLYERGEAVIPPWVASATIAALIRPSRQGTAFRAIVATLQKDAPVHATSEQLDDDFGGASVLSNHRDAIFVGQPGGRVIGWSPASRTELKHWVGGAFANGLSSSLKSLVDDKKHEVILGLDLEGLVGEDAARQRLSADPSFDELLDRAVALVMDAKLVSCSIDATDKLECEVRIVGGGKMAYTTDDADLVKSLFLSVVGDTGYSLPEFHDFTATVDGDSVVMNGVLQDDSLAALTSLGVPPLPSGSTLFEKPTTSHSTRTARRRSPLDDFDRAVSMIESLDKRQKRAKNPASVASWCDRTAGELDDLAVASEDQTVAGFASRSATRLRSIGSSLRGLTADLNAEQASVTYDVRRDPGWASVNVWGGAGYRAPSVKVDSNLREVRARQAKLAQDSAADRETAWNEIQEDISATRRTLLGVSEN